LFENALSRYVAAVDTHCTWSSKSEGLGITGVHLVSQSWHGTIWAHRIKLLVPEKILQPYILLMISGSGDGHEELVMCREISRLTGISVAVLHYVPNQPLFGGLYEDALMAYTFVEFLEGKGWDWPPLLAMVKSLVKAMDAVEEAFKGISGTSASL
jgi:PhoPQ-activated pathogenicity-related protein